MNSFESVDSWNQVGFKLTAWNKGRRNSMKEFIKTKRSSFSGIRQFNLVVVKMLGRVACKSGPICTPNAKLRNLGFNFSSEFKVSVSETKLTEKTIQFWTSLQVCFYSRNYPSLDAKPKGYFKSLFCYFTTKEDNVSVSFSKIFSYDQQTPAVRLYLFFMSFQSVYQFAVRRQSN